MRRESVFSRSCRLISALLAVLMLIGAFPIVARAETASGDLTLDEAQAAPVAALGFSTEQTERYTPSGQVVDRTKSPFGVNKVTKYRVRQLYVNTTTAATLYQASFDTTGLMSTVTNKNVVQTAVASSTVGAASERVSIPADTDGDGKDEVIGVYWVPSGVLGSGKVSVTFTKYTATTDSKGVMTKAEPKTTTYAQVGSSAKLFAGISGVDTQRAIYAVSGDFDHDGKDEVAIGRGDTIALCRVTATALTVLSTLQMNTDAATLRTVMENGAFGVRKSLTVSGMLAADLDDDGFKELFVTAGRDYVVKAEGDEDTDIQDYERGARSYLLIYRYTTDLTKLSAPAVELTATAGENTVYIDKPAMDMGDIFGDGGNELVIGGRLFGRKDDNNVGFTTFHYDPESDSYQTGLRDNRLYTFVSDDFKALENSSTFGMKCVNFNPAAFLSYVVFGGFIYKYNAENDAFDRQAVNVGNTSGLKVNSQAKSKDNLTNVNAKSDHTAILDMVSGNFNEATLAHMGTDLSEQLVVLHHNDWYDSRRIYVTTVSMKDGVLYAYMKEVVNSRTNGYFMSLCAPDVCNRGLQMEFLPGQSEFIFSDPTVIAVLAATPYYSELTDEYEGLGNAKTLFGTSRSKSSSQSNGITVGAHFICGYEWSVSVLGGKIAEAGWELEVSNEFTATFEKSESVYKHILYENYFSQNAVIVSSIPYDCYYFKMTNTVTGASENTMVMIPFSPVTRIMSFSSYNKVAGTVSSVPSVSSVFKHTVGDPRTYPSSKTGLTNISTIAGFVGEPVLLGSNGDDYGNFVGVGIGNNVTEEQIDIMQGKARTLENTLAVKFTMKAGGGGFYAGGGASLGYTFSSTKATEETTMFSGSVAGLPEGREAYSYKWSLAAYPYDLTVGSAKQRCMVVNYLCQPVGANYPPAPPKNFRVDTRSAVGITLKWDAPVVAGVDARGLASGYVLYRADSAEGTYSQIATISGRNTVAYLDKTATGSGPYYYKLVAINTRESTPATLEVPRV